MHICIHVCSVQAADGGDPEACTNIGQLASDGEEAVNWYRLGAEQGDPEAQFLLAQAYLSAHGIGGSHQEALRYLRMAAEQVIPRIVESNL
jgi:TPR repeat protein